MTSNERPAVYTIPQSGTRAVFLSIIFWVCFLGLLFGSGIFIVKSFPASWERFVYGISSTLSALMATWLLLKIDKKTFAEINLVWQNSTLKNFVKGVLLGSFIFGILLSVLLLFADLEIQNSRQGMSLSAAAAYLSIIPLALAEEIAFRAFPFIKLERAFGLRITQWIVAIAFAAYHVILGWDVLAACLGPGIWAFVFGLSARWSGGIAMPTGIHVALNVWQPLVGMSSGTYSSVWILKNNQAISPGQISKADFTGIVLQGVILLAAILLTEYYIKKRTRHIENKETDE